MKTQNQKHINPLSDWFRVLTTVNSSMILKMLKEECGV